MIWDLSLGILEHLHLAMFVPKKKPAKESMKNWLVRKEENQ